MAEMDTIGFIGIGKIGLPICAHLIKAGYRVLGYSRRAVTEFENSGGTPARSPEQIGAQANIVFACLPSDQALEEVMRGADGLICTAHPGQIVVELGSHPIRVKQRYIALLADKGAVFLDGEVSGTPGMVAERKGVIYLAGDQEAVNKIEPVIGAFADHMLYLGPFGAATKVKLINNLARPSSGFGHRGWPSGASRRNRDRRPPSHTIWRWPRNLPTRSAPQPRCSIA